MVTLQLYFEKITEVLVTSPEGPLLSAALASLATDAGLHSLLPYLAQLINDEVSLCTEHMQPKA